MRSNSTSPAQVLGGLDSSRLDRILVRDEQTAVSVTSSVLPFQRVSMFFVTVDVKPGEDADAVSRAPRRDHRRVHRQRPDRRRNSARRHAAGRAELVRDRTSRRLHRQDRGAGQRRDDGRRSWLLPPQLARVRRSDAGQRARGDAAAGSRARCTRCASIPGDARSRTRSQRHRRPAPDNSPPTAQPRDPMPDVGEIADLDFPNVRARAALERHRGRLRAVAAPIPVDAGGDRFRRRHRRRSARRRSARSG